MAGSCVNNNSNAAMLHTESAEARKDIGDQLTEIQKASLKSSVASITTGAFGLGAILGPIMGAGFC